MRGDFAAQNLAENIIGVIGDGHGLFPSSACSLKSFGRSDGRLRLKGRRSWRERSVAWRRQSRSR
jgi:hypothetical protein